MTLQPEHYPAFMAVDQGAREPGVPPVKDLAIGLEVIVSEPSYNRRPPTLYRARLVHKARQYGEFQTLEGVGWNKRTWRLKLSGDQGESGATSNYRIRWYTTEQKLFKDAVDDAHAFLLSQGLVPNFGSPWRDGSGAMLIELARIVWPHRKVEPKQS